MGLQIFTAVWGEAHVEIFRRSCLKSLAFKKNKKDLLEAKPEWNIFTDPKFFEYLKSIIDQVIPEFPVINLVSTEELRDYTDPIQSAVIRIIKKCIVREEKLLMAPPDTIFGDGTIRGLLAAGREKFTCVVVPHPRVLPAIMDDLPACTNPQLVTKAWKYLHRAWSEAETGHKRQNSYIGGVKWSEIEPKLYEVTHRLPTIYLAEFTEEDLMYFKAQGSFGGWDHTWPGDVLIHRGRQRYVGSSDACFIVEITEADKNVPPIFRGGHPDDFWKNHAHNSANKQIVSIFRGE